MKKGGRPEAALPSFAPCAWLTPRGSRVLDYLAWLFRRKASAIMITPAAMA